MITVKKCGEIITSDKISPRFKNDNINGPCVFRRPKFFHQGPEWVMYFAHHSGAEIRQAESNRVDSDWIVLDSPVISVSDTAGRGHVASPEVRMCDDVLELYYHTVIDAGQYTFRSVTRDGINWDHETLPLAHFYFRFLDRGYAIAKKNNTGGVLYYEQAGAFIEVAEILPNMRHCCYYGGYLFWSEVGDSPEKIYVGEFCFDTFDVRKKTVLIEPTEVYEGSMLSKESSRHGAAVNVCQLRDPEVVKVGERLYIFYTVRGEEAIALAELYM